MTKKTNDFDPKKALNAVLRNDLASFTKKTFSITEGGKEYMHNWHIDVISDALEKCLTGEIKRLIINIPPRYMKSVCASVAFPAFLLGHKPNAKIMSVSYNEDLANQFNTKCLELMKSEEYKEIFPGTRIDPKHEKQNAFQTTKKGGRVATSIGGTATGIGGDFMIIDDPLKAGDANSSNALDRVNKFYCETLLSRADNKKEGVIIIIMQRLHMNDLTGFLLDRDVNNEWTHINIPAIAQNDEEWVCKNNTYRRKEGEALHETRESLADLESLKTNMGFYTFSAQYQQDPAPSSGTIIKQEWLDNHYIRIPVGVEGAYVIQAWDTACGTSENNDYSVCVTCIVHEGKYYITDVLREKLEFPSLLKKVISHRELHSTCYKLPYVMVVENASSGISLISALKEKNIRVEAVNPKGDKVSRLYAQSVKFENGSVLFRPKGCNSWLEDCKDEFLRFPNCKHDDQVDATVLALSFADSDIAKDIFAKKEPLISRSVISNRFRATYNHDPSAAGRGMRKSGHLTLDQKASAMRRAGLILSAASRWSDYTNKR